MPRKTRTATTRKTTKTKPTARRKPAAKKAPATFAGLGHGSRKR